MRKRWLNLILRLSTLIHFEKQKILEAGIGKTIAMGIVIMFLELVLLLVSFPTYFFITFDRVQTSKTKIRQEIQRYRLRRKITLLALLIGLGIWLIKILILGFIAFYTSEVYSVSSVTTGWNFNDPKAYIYETDKVQIVNGIVVVKGQGSGISDQGSENDQLDVDQTTNEAIDSTEDTASSTQQTETTDSADDADNQVDQDNSTLTEAAPSSEAAGDKTVEEQNDQGVDSAVISVDAISDSVMEESSAVPESAPAPEAPVAEPTSFYNFLVPTAFANISESEDDELKKKDTKCMATLQPVESITVSDLRVWTGFTEVANKGDGEIYYQLSDDDGLTWYYFNGSWQTAGESDYTLASVINSNMRSFSKAGKLLFKAFIFSDCKTEVQLIDLNITYLRVTDKVAQWRFDESGNDSVGSNNGQIFGATWGSGAIGSALQFAPGDSFVVTASNELKIQGNLSLSFWLRLNALPETNAALVTWSSDGNLPYSLQLNSAGDLSYRHEYGSGENQSYLFSGINLKPERWYFLSLTRDNYSKSVALYVDGKLKGTYSYSFDPSGEVPVSLYLGSAGSGGAVSLSGALDDMAIYNYVLSPADIQGLAQAPNIIEVCTDKDQDGFVNCSGDCNDSNAEINPGARDICDGIDNNCDGQIDEGVVCADLVAKYQIGHKVLVCHNGHEVIVDEHAVQPLLDNYPLSYVGPCEEVDDGNGKTKTKITLCHNGHTITVDSHAVQALLDNKPETYLGPCQEDAGSETDSPDEQEPGTGGEATGDESGGSTSEPEPAVEPVVPPQACAADQVVMYATHDEGVADTIFLKKLSGGTVQELDSAPGYDIEAIDIHPFTGIIYGLTGDVDDPPAKKRLIQMGESVGIPDLSNGITLDLIIGQEFNAMSFHPKTGELWVTGDNVDLRKLDIATGQSTWIADLAFDAAGIAWDNAGQYLYLVNSKRLYRYSPSSQQVEQVCNLRENAAGLEFDPLNNLIVGYDGSSYATTDMIDLATCERVQNQPYTIPEKYKDIEALTFSCGSAAEPQISEPVSEPESTTTPICGDGVLQSDEQCDDGNTQNNDGCSAVCQTEVVIPEPTPTPEPVANPICSNGQLETGETCDDGNLVAGDGCSVICQIEPGATISVTSITCASEADLPNWGASGASDITAQTAQNFIAASAGKCSPDSGWSYQWGTPNVTNPGDNVGVATGAWTTLGPTNTSGIATAFILNPTSYSRLAFREVWQSGYAPFTYTAQGNSDRDNYSAELYCSTDVLHYDNFEYINSPQLGTTYYCVSFNAVDDRPSCGNGKLEEGETCDDGNTKSGDGCSATCKEELGATIIATSVVCNNESELPNWGNGGPNIVANTGQDFVAASQGNCHLAEGWDFQWASPSIGNPGDNTGAATANWTTFGSTDASGQTMTVIKNPANYSQIWLREVWQSPYAPFTYSTEGGSNRNNKSAEFYCNTDVLNYDNYEFITSPVSGQTYYCVAFNVLEEAIETPPTVGDARWRLDEGAGCNTADSLGNNPGTLGPQCASSAPSWIRGKLGSALQFDGQSNYVSISDADTLDYRNAISISAWVYLEHYGNFEKIVTKHKAYELTQGATPGDLRFSIYRQDDAGWEILDTSNAGLRTKTWYFVAGTFNGETLKLYVNGQLVASRSVSSKIAASSFDLVLGADKYLAKDYLSGKLDEVSLFGHALTAGEIVELYLEDTNTAPALTIDSAVQRQTDGYVKIDYTVSDAQSDYVALAAFEYSLTGAFAGEQQPLTPVSSASGHSGLSNLSANPTGISHVFVWNAAADLGNLYDATVYVRLRPTDGISEGEFGTSAAFPVDVKKPVISNIQASQQAGSTLVKIYYDLADDTLNNLFLELDISSDGGQSWVVSHANAIGAFGSGQSVGSAKEIIWDAGIDFDEQSSESLRISLRATDAFQNRGNYAGSPDFMLDARAPFGLNNFAGVSSTTSSIVWAWDPVIEEGNFAYYEIWYGENRESVLARSDGATLWGRAEDAGLLLSGTASTVIPNLTSATTYYAKIWAYDSFGNVATVPEAVYATQALTSPEEDEDEEAALPNQPILDQPVTPTKLTNVILTGTADAGNYLDLYVDQILRVENFAQADSNGSFSGMVDLGTEGTYAVFVVARDATNTSSEASITRSIQIVSPVEEEENTPPSTRGGGSGSRGPGEQGSEIRVQGSENDQLQEPILTPSISTTPNSQLATSNSELIEPELIVVEPGTTIVPERKVIAPVAAIKEIARSVESPLLQPPEITRISQSSFENSIDFEGTGIPNSEILLFVHSEQALIFKVKVDENGIWSFTHAQSDVTLASGDHRAYAVTYDQGSALKSLPSTTKAFNIKINHLALILSYLNLPSTLLVILVAILTAFLMTRRYEKPLKPVKARARR